MSFKFFRWNNSSMEFQAKFKTIQICWS